MFFMKILTYLIKLLLFLINTQILKDVTLRHKLVNGLRINYVPGWDCHGLPIELKVEKLNENKWNNFSPIEIRKKGKIKIT